HCGAPGEIEYLIAFTFGELVDDDEYIHVAVFTRIPACSRAKHRELLQPVAKPRPRQLPEALERNGYFGRGQQRGHESKPKRRFESCRVSAQRSRWFMALNPSARRSCAGRSRRLEVCCPHHP